MRAADKVQLLQDQFRLEEYADASRRELDKHLVGDAEA
jgi:hypothetical protein